MIKELTPEQVREIGQFWGKDYFLNLSAQEKVELISTLPPEERFIGLKPEERLFGLKPQERLAGLPFSELEELEEQIKKLKQQKNG